MDLTDAERELLREVTAVGWAALEAEPDYAAPGDEAWTRVNERLSAQFGEPLEQLRAKLKARRDYAKALSQ